MDRSSLSDKCRLPRPFWQAVQRLGLRPSAVLRHARLPTALHLDEVATITTAQLFVVWNSIESLSGDPAFSLKMVSQTRTATHKLAFLAASYAANYRDGLERIARFKRMCSPDRTRFENSGGLVAVLNDWPSGTPVEPALSVDAGFAMMLELGRRGTGQPIAPVLLEFSRSGPASSEHMAFFACPISFGAERDRMVLRAEDLDAVFPGHNPELLSVLTPALSAALEEIELQAGISDQVKFALKRGMASGRPDIGSVARQMGMSERTLQRRITEQGTTFRNLLAEARQELAHTLLSDGHVDVEETAFMLGFEDSNSFYRAFRAWEGVTPNQWRKANALH